MWGVQSSSLHHKTVMTRSWLDLPSSYYENYNSYDTAHSSQLYTPVTTSQAQGRAGHMQMNGRTEDVIMYWDMQTEQTKYIYLLSRLLGLAW